MYRALPVIHTFHDFQQNVNLWVRTISLNKPNNITLMHALHLQLCYTMNEYEPTGRYDKKLNKTTAENYAEYLVPYTILTID